MPNKTRTIVPACALTLVVTAACAVDEGLGVDGEALGGRKSYTTNTNGGDANKGAGDSSDPSRGPSLGNDATSQAAVPEAEKACATTTGTATPLEVHLVMLVDKSGSMCQTNPADDCSSQTTTCDCNSTASKWQQAIGALGGFFGSKEAKGLFASVIAFPQFPNFDLFGDGFCKADMYDSPITPEVALPDAAGRLRGALASLTGEGSTPTKDALSGAAKWALQVRQKVGARGRVAIVIATDGLPLGCSDEGNIGAAAQVATQLKPTIPTFVVGVGDNLTGLNALAAAGGTGQAIFATGAGSAVGGKIAAALASIRTSVVQCEYTLPAPPAGQTFDPVKVNVNVTRTGGAATPLKYSKDCTVPNAWQYDNPAAPTKIRLCKTTCDGIQSDAQAVVSLQLGCATRGDAPR